MARSIIKVFWPLPLLVLVLSACSAESASQGKEVRFTPVPYGHDSPAGRCVVCHSLEKDGPFRVAPTLWGIAGAEKARFGWYGYSQALAEAGGTWSDEDLNDYLADPDRFLPGTKKTLIGIADTQERAELIEYLKELQE